MDPRLPLTTPPSRRFPRPLVWVGITLVLAAVLKIGLPHLTARFVYLPRAISEADARPERWRISGAEALHIETSDGVTLYGWWLSAKTGGPRTCGTAILFYGNKGNLISRRTDAQSLVRLGWDVILFDYRGYGASGGTPSEVGFYTDAEAVYQYAITRKRQPERVIFMGHSLGAAVATHLAAERTPAALILVAPFTSLIGAARARIGPLADLIVSNSENRFNSAELVGQLRTPVLMVLGTHDRLVSAGDARALFAATPLPKTWLDVPAAGHNDIFDQPTFWSGVRGFLQRAVGCHAKDG